MRESVLMWWILASTSANAEVPDPSWVWRAPTIELVLGEGAGAPEAWAETWEDAAATWNAVPCGAPDIVLTAGANVYDRDQSAILYDDPGGDLPDGVPFSATVIPYDPDEHHGDRVPDVYGAWVALADGVDFGSDAAAGAAECVDTAP